MLHYTPLVSDFPSASANAPPASSRAAGQLLRHSSRCGRGASCHRCAAALSLCRVEPELPRRLAIDRRDEQQEGRHTGAVDRMTESRADAHERNQEHDQRDGRAGEAQYTRTVRPDGRN